MLLNQDDLTLDQVKLMCELFLDSLGTGQKEARNKLSRSKAIVEEIPKDKTEAQAYIAKFLVDYKLTSMSDRFHEYVYQLLSRSSINGVIVIYANTNACRDMIRGKLRDYFRVIPDETAVENIAKCFVEQVDLRYKHGFVNSESAMGYLTYSYENFFQKDKKDFIRKQMNQRGSTFRNAEGELEEVADIVDDSDISDLKVTYDIPDFQKLCYTIFEGSKALGYDRRDDGVLKYDIFSHMKYNMLQRRFEQIKGVKTGTVMSTSGLLSIEDINATELTNPKRAALRRHIVDHMLSQGNGLSLEEQFNETFRKYHKPRNSNTGLVFQSLNDNDPEEVKAKHLKGASQTFLKIKQGINAAQELMRALKRNNIDPLAIPSDIFRDANWLAKVSSFKAYVLMYDNMKALDKEERLIGNIYTNNQLTKQFYGNELQHLKNRMLCDIGKIVSGNKDNCSYEFITDYLVDSNMPMMELYNDALNKTKQYATAFNAIGTVIPMIATILKEEHLRCFKESKYTGKRKLVDWMIPHEGFGLEVYKEYKKYEEIVIKGTDNVHVNRFVKNYNALGKWGNSLGYNILDDDFFNKATTIVSTVQKIGEELVKCLAVVNRVGCSDLQIIDMVDANKNFIAICKGFDSKTDAFKVPALKNITKAVPKQNKSNLSHELVNEGVTLACKLFKAQFDFLNKVKDKVDEHGRRGYHKASYILGTYETKLKEYGNALRFIKSKITDDYFVSQLIRTKVYEGFILREDGKPVTKKVTRDTYYLHEYGYWITTDLDFNHENILRFGSHEVI
ncbi:hypothetical protein UT300012_23060 [Paraclostridium bifermentans]